MWIAEGAVRENIVSGQIPLAISFLTFLNTDRSQRGSWPLPTTPGLRPPLCIESSCADEVAARAPYHEWIEDNISEGTECHVVGQSQLFGHATQKVVRGLRTEAEKSWYPHLFNADENIPYVSLAPEISYYDIDQMGASEKREFLSWYETNVKNEVFDNRLVMESYCQVDVTVL